MRQTNLSLEELKAELAKTNSLYAKCLLVNDVGELCFTGNKGAEAVLRKVLNEGDSCEQYPSFCWLSVLEKPAPETIAALVAFKDDPRNADVVAKAEERLRKKHG